MFLAVAILYDSLLVISVMILLKLPALLNLSPGMVYSTNHYQRKNLHLHSLSTIWFYDSTKPMICRILY